MSEVRAGGRASTEEIARTGESTGRQRFLSVVRKVHKLSDALGGRGVHFVMADGVALHVPESAITPPPPEPNAAVKGRVLQFDGLRALAFGAVYINHSTHLPLTWAGVDVFFVLSGFLITGILLERKSAGGPYFSAFYRRRVFRILPPYLLTIVVYGLIVTWRDYRPVWLFALAPNIQDLIRRGPDIPLWSLAIEEQFYLVWPVVVLFLPEGMLLGFSVAALVVTPILRAVCTPLFPYHFFIYELTPFRADLLCAGAVIAILCRRHGEAFKAVAARYSWMVCVFGYMLFAGSQAFPAFRLARNVWTANCFLYLFSLIGATGLLAWALTSKGWLRRFLTLRPLRYLGEISYTMYLVHVFLFLLLEHKFGLTVLVRIGALGLVIAYASVSWFLMERPLIRFAARRTPRAAKPAQFA